jgi:DNA-directed RNA polymerase subunit K/omega
VTKKKEQAPTANPDAPLSQLILDCKQDKYRMVSLATRWAIEVQKREENGGVQPEELVSMALKEILSGKISMEEVEALPPAPKLVRKAEAAVPVISEELMKRIAEEDALQEKQAKAKKDEEPAAEEEEEEED